MTQLPKPLAAAAGAGDLVVEKMRELSAKAADRLSAMDSDPSAFADRMQGDIENRAESLGTAFRSAQGSVREQAEDLSKRAQGLLQLAVEQAGETYEGLAKRGETVVDRASEQRTLPDVPGLRMIKPAPADEQARDQARADTATGTSTRTATKPASTAGRSTESSTTSKGTAGKSSTSAAKKARGATTRKSTPANTSSVSAGKKSAEKPSGKAGEQANSNGGRGRSNKSTD